MPETQHASHSRKIAVALGLWLVFCVPMALLFYLWAGAAWQLEEQAAGRAGQIHWTSPPMLWAAGGLFGVPVLLGVLALIDRARVSSRTRAT